MHVLYAGRSCRNQAKIKIRQPLSRLLVRPRDEKDAAVLQEDEYLSHLYEELNIKAVELIDAATEEGMITRGIKLNPKIAGRRHGRYFKTLKTMEFEHDAVMAAVANGGTFNVTVDGEEVELQRDDFEMVYAGPDHLAFMFDNNTFVAIDKTLTEELEREGNARDFNRQAQELRKKLDLNVADRIHVTFAGSDNIAASVEAHREFLMNELLALSLERVDAVEDTKPVKVGEEKVHLMIRVADNA